MFYRKMAFGDILKSHNDFGINQYLAKNQIGVQNIEQTASKSSFKAKKGKGKGKQLAPNQNRHNMMMIMSSTPTSSQHTFQLHQWPAISSPSLCCIWYLFLII